MEKKQYPGNVATARYKDKYDKPHIPEKKINDENTQKLFAIMEEGDIFKITEMMMSTKVTPSVRLETGETLCHIVLKSSNLTKELKLKLCEFLIERNAPIGLTDTYNVSPLHIACKYQLKDIIELLIKHGASTTIKDNNDMTPLHYQIMGEVENCKTEKLNKVGTFMTKTVSKEQFTLEVKNINDNILEMMYTDSYINRYLAHIQKTFNIVNDLYPTELHNIQEKYTNDVATIITNNDTTDISTKIQSIIKKTIENKDNIQSLISNKITDSLAPMSIQTNNKDGWGPTSTSPLSDKILPFKDAKTIHEEMKKSINKSKIEVTKKLKLCLANAIGGIGQIKGHYTNWTYFLTVLNQNIIENDGDYFFNKLDESYDEMINIYKGRGDNRLIFNVNNTRNMMIPNMNIHHSGNIDILLDYFDMKSSEIYYYPQRNTGYVLSGVNWEYILGHHDDQYFGYTLLSLFDHYIKMINYNIANIDKNMNVLIQCLNIDATYYTYELLCTNMIIHIINVAIYLASMRDEVINFIQIKFNKINNLNTEHNREEMHDTIDEQLKKINTQIDGTTVLIESIYKAMHEFMSGLNEVVNIVNMLSGVRYVEQYNNKFSNLYDEKKDTDNFAEIYSKSFQPFTIIPRSLDLFKQNVENIDFETFQDPEKSLKIKKKYIELFVPQITYLNNSCYISDNKRNDNNLKYYNSNGVLTDIDTKIQMNDIDFINIVNSNNIITGFVISELQNKKENDKKCSQLGYLSSLDVNNLPMTLYGNKLTYYDSDPEYINKSDDDMHMGLIRYEEGGVFSKMVSGYPIVGCVLDKHIYILKFTMIKYIITKVNAILDNIANSQNHDGSQHLKNLHASISSYITKYKDELNINKIDNYIFFTMIGKMADVAIITFIKACIHNSSIKHTIKVLKQIDEKKMYTIILQKIYKKKAQKKYKVNLFKPETNYKIDLKELIDDIYDEFTTNNNRNDTYKLNYTDILVKENLDTKKQHIIYNYAFNTKLAENRCYEINPEIIDILVKHGASLHVQDINGNTPIFYAIDHQHIEVLKKLIKLGAAINNSLYKNNMGFTPFTYLLNIFEKHVAIMEDPSTLIKEINKKIESQIKKNPNYKNNMIKYGSNIMPQILLMINHHFYILSKQYKKPWTYEKHKSLLDSYKKFNIIDTDNINNPICLLKYVDNLQNHGTNGTQTLEGRNTFIDVNIKELNNKIDDINNSINNLNAELNDINSKTDTYYKDRKKEIEDFNIDLLMQKSLHTKELTKLTKTKYKTIQAFPIMTSEIIKKINNRKTNTNLINKKNSTSLYDNIFTHIINNTNDAPKFTYTNTKDYETYRILWDMYIKDVPGQMNISNMHILLLKYEKELVKQFKNNDIKTLDKNLEIVDDLHTGVFNSFATDYELLPLEYNESSNYALYVIMDILIHVIRHTICVTLYNVISKNLVLYIRNVSEKLPLFGENEEYSKYINGVVDEIMSNGSKKESLLAKYILKTLPEKAVKHITNIYTGDDDPDRLINNVRSLFEPITNMIMINQTIHIEKTSTLIKTLDEIFFPYFSDLLTLFVTEGKNMVDSYLRYLINESRIVKMLKVCSSKALEEKKQKLDNLG